MIMCIPANIDYVEAENSEVGSHLPSDKRGAKRDNVRWCQSADAWELQQMQTMVTWLETVPFQPFSRRKLWEGKAVGFGRFQ
jgi:hypothetical protein